MKKAFALFFLLACTVVPVSADGPMKVLFSFDKGTEGWWSYTSKESSVKLSHAPEAGVPEFPGALKAVYSYKGKGAYLGIGIDPKFALPDSDLSPYAGGFMSLSLKADRSVPVAIEFRTKNNGTYSFSFPGIGSVRGTYSIPLSMFRSKEKVLPEKAKLNQLVIVPRRGSGTLYIDEIVLHSDPLSIPEGPLRFTASGIAEADGSLAEGVKFRLEKGRNNILSEYTTAADGQFLLTAEKPVPVYSVDPVEAVPGLLDLNVTLTAEKEGCALYTKNITLTSAPSMLEIKLMKIQPPKQIHVAGNGLQDSDGNPVWLQGLCIDSFEWSATGESVNQSIQTAIEEWKANCIRLPMKDDFWFGKGKWQKDGGKAYRELIDSAVSMASDRGVYLVLDLHRFGAPMPEHLEFWKDAAARYSNNPAVIFEIFNEPHGISWEIWKDGGDLDSKKNRNEDENAAENDEKNSGNYSVGMQALINAIRGTGANNLIIAGGLDWSYDISQVVRGFELRDTETGNGIMYSSHVYPWKSGWLRKFLVTAQEHPVFIGEVGNINRWEDFSFIHPSARSEKVGPQSQWPIDMIGCIQKYKLNWTAFSFHPSCGPNVIKDWNYTPTDFWGVFVKRALAGEQFEMKRMR